MLRQSQSLLVKLGLLGPPGTVPQQCLDSQSLLVKLSPLKFPVRGTVTRMEHAHPGILLSVSDSCLLSLTCPRATDGTRPY